ncbi:hypothetical protein Glove_131g97 [Diversispora epigaea]|uniref:Uncharacterized protein n=1 Tax=Diversispora epigaea TaxID=1348612 RepID=A0A397IXU7_9GLOM|nr:hypothetical protein Glove_131g97 [Diversispora epigaea]
MNCYAVMFDSAFEGVNNLYDMGAIKTDKEQPLSSDQIAKNVDELKRKLVQELTWKDPLASQVIRDNSDLIQKLLGNFKKAFMVYIYASLILAPLLFFIKGCYKVTNDSNKANNFILETGKVDETHSYTKKSEEKISCVVSEILGTLEDIWNNPALTSEMAKTLNEGTYQFTVIVLTIRAVLKNLPLGPLSFISTSERQSIASADRRGTGRPGDTLHLNVLIKDKTNVHRYYHIQSTKIPVQFSDEDDVIKFVETLLFLRNILITNISLLCHGAITSSQRLKEGSITVTTPRDDYP